MRSAFPPLLWCLVATGSLCAAAPPVNMDPERATKETPFVNSLDMRFVPVPIAGGPRGVERVLFSVWDTRVQDYAVYAKANKVDDAWTKQQRDGVPVGREPNDPAVGVTWDEGQAFCAWLTQNEMAQGKLPKGLKYRLPSDEEWSRAVGLPPEAGTTPAEKSGKNKVDFPWGKDFPPTEKTGNYADEMFHGKFPKEPADKTKDHPWIVGYDDGYAASSPVGSYPANEYGLYDMGGNVWQWCGDWYDASHKNRLLRGASWGNALPNFLLSSFRAPSVTGRRDACYGFRCVLALSGANRPSGDDGVIQAKAPAPSSLSRLITR
jgi:formylglycine-generating enzyme required for sulfatase activity